MRVYLLLEGPYTTRYIILLSTKKKKQGELFFQIAVISFELVFVLFV